MKTRQLISIISCLVLLSCCSLIEKEIKSNDLIESRIKEVIAKGDSVLIMSDLTDFQWDSLLILAPYTYIEDCEQNYGIDCAPIEHSNIQHLDDRCVLVFMNDNEISQMVICMRHPGDFTPCSDSFYTPEESIFEIVVTDQQTVSGETWIEINNIRSTTPNTR